jgi:RNA polymerase II-associated factor 1
MSPGYAKQSIYPATVLHPRCAQHPQLTCASHFPRPICSLLTFCRTSLNDAVDVSREAQLASIDSSFGAARASDDLNALRHPTKPRLRAVATYEVLPDADVWANAYDLFRFSERPGERGPEVRPHTHHYFICVKYGFTLFAQLDDPRLDCAIMRPMESDGDHFLTYYLTKDDDAAELFKDSRADPRGVDTLEEEEDVRFPLSPFLFAGSYL